MKETSKERKSTRIFFTAIILAGITAVFPLSASAAGSKQATVLKVQGKVLISRPGEPTGLVARPGLPLYKNDRIMTRPKARLKILLADKSIISIAGDTVLVLSDPVLGSGKGSSRISLLWGKIKCFVNDLTDNRQRRAFEVNTRTAVIGVRGTVFLVWIVERDLVGICAVDKEVSVTSVDFPGQALVLKPRGFTRVEKGRPPDPPKPVTEDLLDRLHQGLFEEDRGLTPGI